MQGMRDDVRTTHSLLLTVVVNGLPGTGGQTTLSEAVKKAGLPVGHPGGGGPGGGERMGGACRTDPRRPPLPTGNSW